MLSPMQQTYIDIPNNPVLTAHLLDGVNITRELYIVKSAIGIKIRKCVINNKISYNINSDPIYEMLIDRCDINNIGFKPRMFRVEVID